ncbi:hypothetical protein U9M48_045050 [Paspalum notatum var. saurae]|uniref:cysteine dioxygenase n=1 Tax=Paspalum notatum var. saurae TaxID=547442 RepID=A0AAQ3UYD6_PASNO
MAEPRAMMDLTPANTPRVSYRKICRRGKKPMPVMTPMQRLFDTSRDVFANSSPGFVPRPTLSRASRGSLVHDLKPNDIGVNSSMSYFKHVESTCPPKATCLHFYDCSRFWFGIFCLPKSAVIPLHNHPGMTVFSKILFGSMHLKSYDWVKSSADIDDNALENSDARLAKLNTDAVFDASTETVVLYPENGGNLHCFTALTPCAVLDVMAPPYNHADGRNCTYYNETPYSNSCGEFFYSQYPAGGDEQYYWLKEVHSIFRMRAIKIPRKSEYVMVQVDEDLAPCLMLAIGMDWAKVEYTCLGKEIGVVEVDLKYLGFKGCLGQQGMAYRREVAKWRTMIAEVSDSGELLGD